MKISREILGRCIGSASGTIEFTLNEKELKEACIEYIDWCASDEEREELLRRERPKWPD